MVTRLVCNVAYSCEAGGAVMHLCFVGRPRKTRHEAAEDLEKMARYKQCFERCMQRLPEEMKSSLYVDLGEIYDMTIDSGSKRVQAGRRGGVSPGL